MWHTNCFTIRSCYAASAVLLPLMMAGDVIRQRFVMCGSTLLIIVQLIITIYKSWALLVSLETDTAPIMYYLILFTHVCTLLSCPGQWMSLSSLVIIYQSYSVAPRPAQVLDPVRFAWPRRSFVNIIIFFGKQILK